MVFGKFPPPRYDRLATETKAGAALAVAQVLATQTLAAVAASITFSNIPQTFRNLLLLGKLRSTIAGTADDGFMRLNSDATANYDSAYLYVNGTTVAGGTIVASTNGIYVGALPGSTSAANNASAIELTLPDYARTAWRKSGHARASDQSETRQVCLISDGSWRNTAAVTSLTIYASGGNLAANSTVTLYGLY